MDDNIKNILVVDDSNVTRLHICSILNKEGYKTKQAENGYLALKYLSDYKPDIIVLDLLMPEMDGIMLLKELKTLKFSIPVIIISADIQDDVRNECFELGVVAFLNKPFKVQDLIDVVANNIIEK